MRPAELFSDGVVLQRRRPIRIWGRASRGDTITVTLDGVPSASSLAEHDGAWTVILPAQEAATGRRITFSDGSDTITVVDVSIGEVWIAGGQSNMEFTLAFDAERDVVLGEPGDPQLRFLDVPKLSYDGQEGKHDYAHSDRWRMASGEDLRYFPSVGLHFGRELRRALQVPVGVVGCTWGGTPAIAWADVDATVEPGNAWIEAHRAGLEQIDVVAEADRFRSDAANDLSDPFGNEMMNRILRTSATFAEMQEAVIRIGAGFSAPVGSLHQTRPGGLFGTMVRRIAGFSARGVIWYQGESDVPHAELHAEMLSAVVRSWRDAWSEDLPFLITQVAPYGSTPYGTGERFPVIRAQQEWVARSVPSVWMASSSDAGLETDIHPKVKRPIGVRLALLARGHVYGEAVLCDAPSFTEARRHAHGVDLRFEHADGLGWDGSELPLRLTPPDGEPLRLRGIEVLDDAIRLHGDVPHGTRVDFAQTGYYVVGLRNAAGIPALPFATTV
ncbi:MAG: sialate O-acetylesterase [Pseudolysinimonas sp.]